MLRSACTCTAGPIEAIAKVLAAYDSGCRRFDSAIGGMGGCPFAQDVLVGNIPTEKLLEALKQRDVEPPLKQAHHRALPPGGGHRQPLQRAEDVTELSAIGCPLIE